MGDPDELAEQLKEELKAEVEASRQAYDAQRARREAAQAELDKVEDELRTTNSQLDSKKHEVKAPEKELYDMERGMYISFGNTGIPGSEKEKYIKKFRQLPHYVELTTRIGDLQASIRSLTAAATALEAQRDEVRSELRDAEVQERETKAIYDETQTEYDKVVERDFSERLWRGQAERFDPFKRAYKGAVLERYDPASSGAVLERYDPDKPPPKKARRTRRVASIAVGATIAIGATVVGVSILGGGSDSTGAEAPAVVAPSADQSDTGQSGSSGAPSDAGGVEDQGSDDEIGDAGSGGASALDFVEIGRMALKGTGRTLPDGQAFDAFFQLLFVPSDAIATINRLYDEEDYLDSAADELTAATGGEVIAEVEVTQFSADPATGTPGQNSFGVVVQLDPTTFMMAAFGTDGSTFSEANAFLLNCDGFSDCELRGANLGGPFGLDPRRAIRDAIGSLQEGPTQIPDGYGWLNEIGGTITGVGSPQSVVNSQTLPIQSGTFQGRHWIKWQLDEPVPDQVESHTTYSLNISSSEDGLWIAGYTFPLNEAAFASGGCLEDRPDCGNGEVLVEGELSSARDAIIFWLPEGTFGNATGLKIFAFKQTYVDPNAAPETEAAADGAPIPLEIDVRPPPPF